MTDPSDLAPSQEGSSLDLDPNHESALCYLFIWLSGIILFLVETRSARVRFHALQSILMFSVLGVLSFLSIILSILTNLFLFRLANALIWMAQFVAWILMVIKTYQGKTIKVPFLGDLAQRQAGWPEK